MSKNAIILYYDGTTPSQSLISHLADRVSGACNAELKSIVVKHYNEDAIVEAVGDDAVRKIVFDKTDEEQKVGTVKVCFSSGQSKLQVVKFIKEKFGYGLKEAKDIVDEGVITLALTTDAYQFVRDLSANGGCIVNGSDEHYAVAQAAVFINGKYPGSLQARENLVKDFAMAKYHDRVNTTDDIEKALLNTVQIVKEHPDLASQWINYDLMKTITML